VCFEAADPVELRPGHGGVPAVGLGAAAGERLLGQEEQVLLGQAPLALHLRLVLGVEGLAQLGPQHLVGHLEGHTALHVGGERHHGYTNHISS